MPPRLPGLPSLDDLFGSSNPLTGIFVGNEEGERNLGLARTAREREGIIPRRDQFSAESILRRAREGYAEQSTQQILAGINPEAISDYLNRTARELATNEAVTAGNRTSASNSRVRRQVGYYGAL